MARTDTQPVRLPGDLIEKLRVEAKMANRSLPAEAEARLRNSLGRGTWAEVEPRLTPHARALGRLLGFLANELVAYSPPGEEKNYLQRGVARMLERIGGKELSGPEGEAATMADYWALRLANSRERTYENGAPVPMPAEQRVLIEIQSDLATGRAAPPQEPPRARNEAAGDPK